MTFTPADGATVVPITVRVTDNGTPNASTTKTITVNVLNVAPTLTISGAATVDQGANYTLNLSSTDPGADTITGWLINWGDGTESVIAGNPPSVTKTYPLGGSTYTITATATDEDGTYSSNTLDVAVTAPNVAPIALAQTCS